MEKSQRLLVPLLPLVGVVGCDLSPKDEDVVTSGGVVNKGILAEAIATAYKAGTDDIVKRVYTEVDGTFSLDDVNFDGTLYVEVKTTSQTLATCDSADGCGDFPGGLKLAGESDKNLNGRIDFGDKYFFNDIAFVLSAYIKKSDDGSRKFAVTPLTHLAAEKIKSTGNVNPENVQIVNAQIAELFGLDGADITRVVPPDITNTDQMLSATPAQRMYAALNAAVASAASETVSVAKVINDLATTFVEDGGLIANSTDPNKVTLASLQSLANDVAGVVEQELDGVDMDVVQAQIQQEITEQLAQTPDTIVQPSANPILEPDFDGDGVSDDREAELGTDPFDADSDDDGLIDGKEIEVGTDPLNSDTDSDGMLDGWEVLFELDPLTDDSQLDPDGDQLKNIEEFNAGSNPNSSDTDGDGINDFDEVNTYGTNPASADSDGDGLTDPDEINTYQTDPLDADTDNDSMRDGWEIGFGLDPLNASDATLDLDSDGLTNKEEHILNTNPNSNDTDGDGTLDGDEDFDNDGIINSDELDNGLNPFFDDSQLDPDGDTVVNIDEVNNQSDPFVPNPAIEFVSDADIYANGSTGAIHIDVLEDSYIASTFDLSDRSFIDGITDNNSQQDILIHDLNQDKYELPIRQNSSTSLLSDGSTTLQDATLDRKYLLLSSSSTQVVSGDGNATTDLFIYNRLNQNTKRLTRFDSTEFNGMSYPGRMSQDGRYAVFKTGATNFPGITDTNASDDIYRYDSSTEQSTLISRTNGSATTAATGNSYEPELSANGNRIVFTSGATDLDAAGDTNGSADIYFYEVSSNTMMRVSRTVDSADDTSTPPSAYTPKISKNGKYMVYSTTKDILNNGVPSYTQFYFVDIDNMLAGATVANYTKLITASFDGGNSGYGDSFIDSMGFEISSDGRFVFYKSASQNLDPLDANGASLDDIFMWERDTGVNRVLTQYVYGDNGTNYDDTPSSHTNAMGVLGFKLNSDNTHLYAILDYGDEYTTAPASCTSSATYCLYKLKLFIPTQDSDNDGLSDRKEGSLFSDPNDNDTDNDGLTDGVEINTTKTSPINPDTDSDGVGDGAENSNGTDPLDDGSF